MRNPFRTQSDFTITCNDSGDIYVSHGKDSAKCTDEANKAVLARLLMKFNKNQIYSSTVELASGKSLQLCLYDPQSWDLVSKELTDAVRQYYPKLIKYPTSYARAIDGVLFSYEREDGARLVVKITGKKADIRITGGDGEHHYVSSTLSDTINNFIRDFYSDGEGEGRG